MPYCKLFLTVNKYKKIDIQGDTVKFIKGIFMLLIMGSLFIGLGGLLFRVGQEPVVKEEVEAAIKLPYVIDPIPLSNKRPGQKRRIKYIVVHNTANPESTARNERDYLTNPINEASTSFHIAVDDTEIIEAIPVTEIAFHAGDTVGNKEGIGIEICESGDYEKAEENATLLIAYLMKAYDIPLENVTTHEHFSGKSCPRLILDHWGHFIDKVEEAYNRLK